MHKLIINNITKRRLQSTSLLLSVLISTAVLFTLAETYLGVSKGIATSQARLGADIMLVPDAAEDMLDATELLFTGAPAPIYMDESVVEKILEIDGVTGVTTQFYGQTLSEACCSPGNVSRLVGIDFETDWVVKPWLQEQNVQSLAADEIIIGSEITGFEDGTGLIRGNTVHVKGVLEPTGTGLDYCVLMDIHTVRSLMENTEEFAISKDLYGDAEKIVSTILIDTQPDRIKSVSIRLRALDHVHVIATDQILSKVSGQMQIVFLILLAAAALLCLCTAIQLFDRFYTMAWDRRNELGLYRALGASERDLKTLLLGEAAVFSVGGSLLGIGCGILLSQLFIHVMETHSAFPFIVPPVSVLLLVSVGLTAVFILISLLAILVPLRQTAKIDPMLAMQKKDID